MSKKILTVLLILALIGLNVFLVWPLFLGEYDANNSSIGIAHILNARYLSRFISYGWNPFWYGGFPNHLIYPLLAPIFLATIQKLLPFLSMPQVYRLVVASAYVLTPIGIFFLVRYITKSTLASFLASFLYILAPSANYFLISGYRVIGTGLHFLPWQLSVISDYGEGPHTIALAIVPFAVISFWKLLRSPTFKNYLLTAVLIAVVIAINLFSAYALFYFMLAVFISEIILGNFKQKFLVNLMLLPAIYGLVAFCYDPSMLSSLAKSSYIHPENAFRLPPLTTLFLIIVFGLIPLAFIVNEIFRKKEKLQNGLVLGIWFIIFWTIPFLFYKGIWFGSQPNRYMPELNITCVIIVSILFVKVINLLTRNLSKIGKVIQIILILLFIRGIGFMSKEYLTGDKKLITAHPNISMTSEYKIAKWLEQNISYGKGERAYLSGSPAFFLNEFADVPQIRGDEDNAQADPWWADITYQINRGEDATLALGWLEAFNVKYIFIPVTAITPYNDIVNIDRFSSLPVIYEIDGFKIYEVGGDKNIIKGVDLGKINALKPFTNPIKPVLDKKGLTKYLSAVNFPVTAQISYLYEYRTNPDLVKVKVTRADKNTGILFKTTYNKGWKAKLIFSDNKKEINLPITKIGPSFMLIKPEREGNYTLEITYHRPLSEYLGYLTTVVTIIVLTIFAFKKKDGMLVEIGEEKNEETNKDYL